MARIARKQGKSLRLPPVRNITRWWHSPYAVVCLFPDWDSTPQEDWPNNLIQTDFPLWNDRNEDGLSLAGRFLPGVARDPEAELNRRVIEKVLGIGGEVEVPDWSGRNRLIGLADIPHHRFYITEVKVVAKHPFTDDDVALLVGLPRPGSGLRFVHGYHGSGDGCARPNPVDPGNRRWCQNITDAGLEHLTGLNPLGFLDVNTCKGITDQAFEDLNRNENLRQLNLAWTSTTQETVEAFKKRRPDCNGSSCRRNVARLFPADDLKPSRLSSGAICTRLTIALVLTLDNGSGKWDHVRGQ